MGMKNRKVPCVKDSRSESVENFLRLRTPEIALCSTFRFLTISCANRLYLLKLEDGYLLITVARY